jgi:thiol-disulfide isomerase/thioredoxin
MATVKERLIKWKETRSVWQKVTDILFWLLLILLIVPGPRKIIATGVNKVFLQVKTPGLMNEENQEILSDLDYGWVLAWDQNEPFYFSNARDEVVFLNFWATWCAPCVAELPEIQKLYEKYGDRVAFMLVTNESPEVVKAFMEKHGYVLPVFYMGTTPPQALAHNSLPTTFIISRDGKVVTRKKGAAKWNSRATEKIFEGLLK